MYRAKDFDEFLSEQLKDMDFAREFFLSTMQDLNDSSGLSLFEALKLTIRKMGITEYAEAAKMERASLQRIITQDSPPKVETLNRILEPLKLKVRLDVVDVA